MKGKYFVFCRRYSLFFTLRIAVQFCISYSNQSFILWSKTNGWFLYKMQQRQQPTNFLSAFNHFVGLALKGLLAWNGWTNRFSSLRKIKLFSKFCRILSKVNNFYSDSKMKRFFTSEVTLIVNCTEVVCLDTLEINGCFVERKTAGVFEGRSTFSAFNGFNQFLSLLNIILLAISLYHQVKKKVLRWKLRFLIQFAGWFFWFLQDESNKTKPTMLID